MAKQVAYMADQLALYRAAVANNEQAKQKREKMEYLAEAERWNKKSEKGRQVRVRPILVSGPDRVQNTSEANPATEHRRQWPSCCSARESRWTGRRCRAPWTGGAAAAARCAKNCASRAWYAPTHPPCERSANDAWL